MTRKIRRAAVIGSGVMGGGIAALLASAGVRTILLDILPRDLKDEEDWSGDPIEDISIQNIEVPIVFSLIEKIYGKDFSQTGGFDREGVLFIENKASGTDNSGVWIGIKKPDDRFQTGNELIAALENLDPAPEPEKIELGQRIRRLFGA